MRTTLRVAALGDSITAGSPLWDPNPAVRQQLGDSETPGSQFEFWAERALGGGVRIRNCGVFGERTDQIASRFDSCTRGANVVVIQGGINDIAQGRPVSTAASWLDRLVKRARAKGLTPLLAEVLPWNRGWPAAAPLINRLNGLIRGIGAREHVQVLPFYSALEDPRHPDFMPLTLTEDGDHPNVDGYRRLGRLLARYLHGASLRH